VRAFLLYLFGAVFFLSGLVALIYAIDLNTSGDPQNPILGPVLAASFLVMGMLMVRAAKTRYPVGLRLIIGGALTFLGVAMAAMGLEEMQRGQTQDLIIIFALAAVFLVAGILLIRWGLLVHYYFKR
jgi:hypothetical protein